MIVNVHRSADRMAAVVRRYTRWERQAARRFSGWSVRRRWVTFVVLPTLMFCCGGTVAGIPVAWILRQTIEASRGAPSPDVAADSYLMALGYNNEDGLLPILDNDHQAELLAGWHAYREAMDNTTPAPSRLDFGALSLGPVANGHAEVTTEVSATWWGTDGKALSYSSEEHTWRFQTRDDNGWQVVVVEAPAWCGGYVRLDACA